MDTRQSQRCKFKEIAKNSNFRIFHKTQHATHLLKLVDKMYKYEMDLPGIVEDTERTRFCPQTDRGTDRGTDILEKTQMCCDKNRWRLFCSLRIVQESGVYQLGVPQGQGDSSAPSTTDPLIAVSDRQTRWNQYTPLQLRWAKGIISSLSFTMVDFRQNTMLDRTPNIPKLAHKERAGVSFVRSNQSLVNFPHKGQWCGALMFSLILRLNKWLSKQSWGWWFEKLSHPLWRHCNGRICHHH